MQHGDAAGAGPAVLFYFFCLPLRRCLVGSLCDGAQATAKWVPPIYSLAGTRGRLWLTPPPPPPPRARAAVMQAVPVSASLQEWLPLPLVPREGAMPFTAQPMLTFWSRIHTHTLPRHGALTRPTVV